MSIVNPYDKAHELARAITQNEIYINYVAAKKEIDKYPEIKERIMKLRQMQMELNKAQILGEDLSSDKIKEATLEFAKLNQDRRVADFFNAEARYIQMFTDIQEIIQKAVEKDF